VESERTAAAEQLVRLLDGARPMPLMRNRVRVDKADASALLEIILTPGREDHSQEGDADLIAAALRVREVIRDAYPVPLTDQVRLSTGLVGELTDALRAAIGSAHRQWPSSDREHLSP
jgi:hypothetical protein